MVDLSTGSVADTALQTAGLTTDQLQTAVTNLTGIDRSTQSAILDVASNGPNINSVANLVAAGFAATGIGAPVAAAITMGLPLVEGLASLLQPTPQYQWRIGKYGVALGSKQAYGPKDPHWKTFPQFVSDLAALKKVNDALGSFASKAVGSNPDDWIPGMTQQMTESLDKAKTVFDQFRLAYNAAWRLNSEFLINGHQQVPPYVLLTTLADAWNKTHTPASAITITGTSGPYYLNHLINGDYDSQDHPPIRLFTGAVQKPAPPPSAPKPVLSSAVTSPSQYAASVARWAALEESRAQNVPKLKGNGILWGVGALIVVLGGSVWLGRRHG